MPTGIDLSPTLPSTAVDRSTGTPMQFSNSDDMVDQDANGRSDWRIAAPILVSKYPHPRASIDRDPFNEQELRVEFATAPWVDPVEFKEEALLGNYEYAGMLPGDVPLSTLDTYNWSTNCVTSLAESLHGSNEEERRIAWT